MQINFTILLLSENYRGLIILMLITLIRKKKKKWLEHVYWVAGEKKTNSLVIRCLDFFSN
jgi:hypothetical protein